MLRFRVPGIELKNPSSPEIRKKYEKYRKKIRNPPSRVGPRKYEKNTKNTKIAQKWPFSYFFCIFFVFSGPDPGWGISYFFVCFSYFFRISGLEGFLSSIPGTRNRNTKWTFRIFFIFFLLGEGEGGARGARRGGGDWIFLLKIPAGGGGFQEGRGQGPRRVSAANWGIFGGP